MHTNGKACLLRSFFFQTSCGRFSIFRIIAWFVSETCLSENTVKNTGRLSIFDGALSTPCKDITSKYEKLCGA